jgi:hypothetical protein
MSFMKYSNNLHLQFDFIACNYQSTIGSYIVLVYLCTPIFQAEGASTEQALSSALTSIMDALKSTDWNTRKDASQSRHCEFTYSKNVSLNGYKEYHNTMLTPYAL